MDKDELTNFIEQATTHIRTLRYKPLSKLMEKEFTRLAERIKIKDFREIPELVKALDEQKSLEQKAIQFWVSEIRRVIAEYRGK